jgi:hypothetical protein
MEGIRTRRECDGARNLRATAQNVEAERKATEIRLRAERRIGELLRELPREHGGDRRSQEALSMSDYATLKSPFASALDRTGISRQRAQRDRRWR